MPVLMFWEFGLKIPIHAPFWVVMGIWPLRRDTISTNLTNIPSKGHSGSSVVLPNLASIVVPEKLHGQKRCDKEEAEEEEQEEEEHEFLGVFDVFLK